MANRRVNLARELKLFAATNLENGRYEDASQVPSAERLTPASEYEPKLAALRAAIDDGDASGIAEGNVFGRVRKSLKLPVSR